MTAEIMAFGGIVLPIPDLCDTIWGERILIICVGFLLDLIFGDPHFLWHPVIGIGKLITAAEKLLRRGFHICARREADQGKKRAAGVILVLIVLMFSVGIPMLLLYAAWRIDPPLKTLLSCVMCYQMLAMRSLKTESMKVYTALKKNDIGQARTAVSMIVGRDTEHLDEEGITKAAIETVAENTSDGVIAPLFYMILFGAAGGFFYKAVNTMDSMVGYKNDDYLYLGTAAAKLDDLLNFIPARLSAAAMIICAFLLGMDGKNAVRIFRRDRFHHASPNSAQTESVCAGALSVQLAGDAYYFGQLYHKPTIGDDNRSVEPGDIRRANRLMYGASFLTLLAGVLVMTMIWCFI